MLRATNPIDLRSKRNNLRKIEFNELQQNSFVEMVNLTNKQLVERYNEKIERKNYSILISRVNAIVNDYDLHIPGVAHDRLVEQIVDSITGYDILQPWIVNKAVANIEVEAPDEIWYMEKLKWRKAPVSFGNIQNLHDYIYRIFTRLNGRYTLENPLGKVEDDEWNLRIRASGFDIRPDSPTISIRKLRKEILSAKEIRYAMSESIETFLRFAARAGYTLALVGPFGSGKTSLLANYLSWIPPLKHVGLIQSANEIQKVHPFMRRGLTREIVGEHGKKFAEIELLDYAKQENYDVLALGEFLNEAALVMLHILQLNIQSAFTYHARDPRSSIHSFIFMMMRAGTGYPMDYLVKELATNMDLVVIMDRLRVVEVAQFTGEIVDGEPVYETLFRFDVDKEDKYELLGSWRRNTDVKLCEKLRRKATWNGAAPPPELELL